MKLSDLKQNGTVRTGPPLYSGNDFERLAQERVNFTITGGQAGNDDNGTYIMVNAIDTRVNQPCILKFRSHISRDDEVFSIIGAATAEPVTDVGVGQINVDAEYPLFSLIAL